MTYTDVSTINNTQGISSVFSLLNEVTFGWFMPVLITSVWIISAIAIYQKNKDYTGAFAVSSYVCFVLSLFLWLGDLLNNGFFGIVTAITIISTIVLFFDRE